MLGRPLLQRLERGWAARPECVAQLNSPGAPASGPQGLRGVTVRANPNPGGGGGGGGGGAATELPREQARGERGAARLIVRIVSGRPSERAAAQPEEGEPEDALDEHLVPQRLALPVWRVGAHEEGLLPGDCGELVPRYREATDGDLRTRATVSVATLGYRDPSQYSAASEARLQSAPQASCS